LSYKNNIYNPLRHFKNQTPPKENETMTAKTPASCPGISQFMRPTPSYLKCPKCQANVEIWSDEEQASCPNCGTVVSRSKPQSCLDWCEFADKCKDLIETKKKERGEQ